MANRFGGHVKEINRFFFLINNRFFGRFAPSVIVRKKFIVRCATKSIRNAKFKTVQFNEDERTIAYA